MVKTYVMDITCAILAGGMSKRMGRDKATMDLGTTNLLRLVHEKVREVIRRVIIVSSIHDHIPGIDAPIYKDLVHYRTPMSGIVSALVYADTERVFILACDMPFISSKALQYMIDEAETGEDIVIPKVPLGYEPLHAIYRKSCIPHFFRLLEHGRVKVTEILPFVTVKVLEGHPSFIVNGRSIFTNINTTADLEMVKEG